MTIRIALREARQAAGMTQEALAHAAKCRQATISDMESGRTRRVDLHILARICHALHVQPGDLIKR